MNSQATLFTENATALSTASLPKPQIALLNAISSDPAQHFFKVPFSSIVLVERDRRINSVPSHPSTFYPGSPFDVFLAIRRYVREGKVIVPRMYLYPTTRCNANCPICQFHFRHKSPRSVPLPVITRILDKFAKNAEGLRAPALIISGDGEPTLHPDFAQMLDYAGAKGLRTFLTSNWILAEQGHEQVIDSVARNVSMITVSIKGLGNKAYDRYQGFSGGKTFERVLRNVTKLLQCLRALGRRNQVMVGIASLILPENTEHYGDLLEWCAQHELDYVYLNVVEPSHQTWGISFTPEQQIRTLDMLARLSEFTATGMVIRHPQDPFRASAESVYYDATTRLQQDICGSALWNPILLAGENGGMLMSCRNSDLFANDSYWYSTAPDELTFEHALTGETAQKVMAATRNCRNCRLERQVKMFDALLTMERASSGNGEFMLEFDLSEIGQLNRGRQVAFEQTFGAVAPSLP